MPTNETLIAFALASAVIMLLPGPANFFILAQGTVHGRQHALRCVLGVEIASAIRVLMTAGGLSALLVSSEIAFAVIRWTGITYLLYLALHALRSEPSPALEEGATLPAGAARAVGKGLFVGLGNPKTLIFFISFVPQFIHAGRGSYLEQVLVLGGIYWAMGATWDVTLAWASGSFGTWLHKRPRLQSAQQRVEGLVYLTLAGWSIATGESSS